MKNDPSNEPHMMSAPSHYVEANGYGTNWYQMTKELVYLSFETVWRKEPVIVTMEADRYRHSSGLSDWRITVHNVKPEVSDTARSRLRDQLTPLVKAWLESPEYEPSEKAAYHRLVRDRFKKAEPYYDDPMRDVRTMLREYFTEGKLSQESYNALITAADAYDQFASIYKEL